MEKTNSYKQTSVKYQTGNSIRGAYNKPPVTTSTRVIHNLPPSGHGSQNAHGYDITSEKFNILNKPKSQITNPSKSVDKGGIKRSVTGQNYNVTGKNGTPSNSNQNYVPKGAYKSDFSEENQK